MSKSIRMLLALTLAVGLSTASCDGDSEDSGADVSFDTATPDTGPTDTGSSQCQNFCTQLDECSIPFPNCPSKCQGGGVEEELLTCVAETNTCDGVRQCFGISPDAGGTDGSGGDDVEDGMDVDDAGVDATDTAGATDTADATDATDTDSGS